MARKIRIGLVGCGVVGTGVLEILAENGTLIADRLGAELEVRHVVVGDPKKPRSALVPSEKVTTDVDVVLRYPEVDVVVEVMGGVDRAYSVVRGALDHGKHVVTANKALLAERGEELLAYAESKSLDVYYEAAVAGGIPIIRVLREGLVSDRVLSLHGIVNGTSNYILTRMRQAGLGFAEALREAQEKGYAEADPTLDVGGGDASHKLAILARLAFGKHVGIDDITTEGIDRVSRVDMEFAQRFGYEIKSLAIARTLPDGRLDLRVHPTLVPEESALAGIHGALNAVSVHGAMVGPSLLSGLGAGAKPTAVSVVSDVVDVARNILVDSTARIGTATRQRREDVPVLPIGELVTSYYLRLTVKDRPGVLARVTTVLAAHGVSIEEMVQQRPEVAGSESSVTLVMLTHEAKEAAVRGALAEIDGHDDVLAPTNVLRIEENA